jgi:hypothetical protein
LQEVAKVYGYADDLSILSENLMVTRRVIKIIEK